MGSYEPSDSELHVEAMDGDIRDSSNTFEPSLFDNKEFPDLCDDFVLEQLSRIGLTTQFDDDLTGEKDLSLARDDDNEVAFDIVDDFISYPDKHTDPDTSCVDQDQQLVDFSRTDNVVAKTDVSERTPVRNIGENGICASQGNQENLLCCFKSGEDFLSGNVGSLHGDAVDTSVENVEVPITPLSLTTEPAECVRLSSDTKNTMDTIEESMNYGWVDKEKQDSLAGGMADSINQKQQPEKNSCIIATQLPVVNSGFATEVSTSSLLPMVSGAADDSTRRQLVSNDLVIDGCNGDPSCSNTVDSCRLRNTDEKDNSKINLDFVSTSSDMVLSPPRRSTRRNKFSQFGKLGTTSSPRGKTVKKKLRGELIFNAVRRKRSCPCIRARSSTWGSTLDFVSVKEDELTQKDRNHLIQVENQRADRRTVGPGNGRRKKVRAASSVTAKEKSYASNDHSNHIRLKVKMGGQKGKRSLTVVQSEVFDLPNHVPTVVSKCVTRSGDSINTEIIENDDNSKLEDGLYVDGQYNYASKDLENTVSFPGGRILDSPHVDKDLESTVTQDTSVGNIFGSCPRGYSQVGTEGMEEVICKPYSDPGTSPDSEVISLIQDISLGADAVLTTTQTVGPAVAEAIEKEFISSSKQYNSGEVKGTAYSLNGFIAGGEKPLGQNKKNKSAQQRWEEKVGHGYNLMDNSYLVSSGNESRNFSNDNIETHKLLELGDLGDSLKVESISRSPELLEKHVGVESSEISTPKGFLDVDKTMGLNASSKSTFEVREQRSAASVTASSKRKNAREQKKQGNRKSVNKRKVKEKHPLGQAVDSGESHRETGDGINISVGITGASGLREPAGLTRDETMRLDIPDRQVASIANNFGSEDVSKLSISSSGLDGQVPQPNAWVRCDDCYKWRCISTELADSIEATNCKWICSDNMDKAFADCSIPQEKSNAAINAELELSEFSGEEDASCAHPVAKGLEGKQPTVPKQAPWRPIVSNMFLHRNRKTQTIDEIMICHCKPPANGGLGCGDECLNRILNIECVRGTCPCGDRCSNQQFQKRKYAKLECFRCGKKGYGLQLLENVSEGDFLIEYVGEVLDLNAYEARQREYASRGQKHFYFMTLNGSEVIDACAKGNLGRFINHSCDPNCRTEKWMVNGEVSIGLFAMRNIKKGEEVTFDYNYVRVFGAAAKKCVCGSSECRGYIGGDPLNTDAVVQGDSDEEFPEPVMVHGNGKIEKVSDKMTSNTISDGEQHVDETVVLISSDENLGSSTRMEESTSQRQDAVQPIEHYSLDRSLSPVQPHMPIKTELVMNKSLPCIQPSEKSLAENTISTILSSSQLLEASSAVMDTSSKSSSNGNSICDSVKERPNVPKARSPPKSSRSLKEGKSRSNPGVAKKLQTPANKPKKVLEGVASNAPKGVEEFLNVLLDPDGAISKKKDAAKGYLKLLFVTASSGDNVKGEAVQSTRDLSIILDALLKTKKRTVLNDIINKNGLQMLHNIMKQNRKNFNRTPIIRKLLKILESLAEKEILTLELIHSGPPCVGMESFRESIMQLTNHNDIQVHQIARNFRDKWMPRPFKRNGYLDRDGINMEQLPGVHCNRSATYDRRCDRGLRPMTDIDSISQTVRGANPSFAYIEKDGRSYQANGSRTRKRKSRWDQPGKGNSELQSLEFVEDQKVKQKLVHGMQQSEIKEGVREETHNATDNIVCHDCDDSISQQAKSAASVDEMQTFHDDAPPGFPSVPTYDVSPTTSNLSSEIHHKICSCEVVTGCVQERFLSHLPVAYGVPLLFVEKLATHQPQVVNSWDISPGIPFHPFPPLPPFPRERSNSIPSSSGSMRMENEESQRDSLRASHHHTDAGSPCTSGARQADVASTGSYNQPMGGRTRCSSGNLGRRYFRQQKWNSARCGSWVKPKKMGWGFKGNNSRSGTCSLGLENLENEKVDVRHSEVVSGGDQNMNSAHYQNPEYHCDH